MTFKTRRSFLRQATAGAALTALGGLPACTTGSQPDPVPSTAEGTDEPWFRISLAEWSLHRTLGAGDLDNLGFITAARRDYGIDAVEYVNSFFFEQAENIDYLKSMIERCDGEGVRSLLIMCDNEGRIGDPDAAARTQAVENHYKWVEAARTLGCHSIRVNAQSAGTEAEQHERVVDGLRSLVSFADDHEINVIVENHGGLSSNGKWLAGVLTAVDHPRCGSLPDFGNFWIDADTMYDRYRGVEEMMPFAKAVSAKSNEFDAAGNDTGTDYLRMVRVVLKAGYRGWIGIEYEGSDPDEPAGIRATKRLLERVRDKLAGEFPA